MLNWLQTHIFIPKNLFYSKKKSTFAPASRMSRQASLSWVISLKLVAFCVYVLLKAFKI